MHGCPRQCSTAGTDEAIHRGTVSEMRCTKHNNGLDSTRMIWGEEEYKRDVRRLAIAAGQAFDLCRWPRSYRCPRCLRHPHYLGSPDMDIEATACAHGRRC